ncbi:5'-methylthioadenosine/S-adenosylhomocysteine nucleosidase [Streptomyces sp. NPDC000594]|uniref:5'-methylthioadenosine/S-adenosylhomocysteine nucleosidase family protein n=1 Tax=Streptomyces sp. NPDC000594 TaxID=3154261 RepID=UPI003331C92E
MSEAAEPLAVVVTALPVEYMSVREHITVEEELVHPYGTRVERARLPGTQWHIGLVEAGMGAGTTAILTERLIEWLTVRMVIFVGVAGGLKDDIKIGDVVIANKVYGIHGGKSGPEGFLVRPAAWPVSHRLDQAVRAAMRGRQDVHVGAIASGDVVLADESSDIAVHLREHYNDALALDMEAVGLVEAAHLAGGLDALVVRGISDKANDGKAAADAAGSQKAAAGSAAAAMVTLLALLDPVTPRPGPPGPPAAPRREEPPGDLSSLFPDSLDWAFPKQEHDLLRVMRSQGARSADGRLTQRAVVSAAAEVVPKLTQAVTGEILRSLIGRGYVRRSPGGRLEVTQDGLQALARWRGTDES